MLGFAILLSFITTKVLFGDYLISVWCFFAAMLSLIVLGITSKFDKQLEGKIRWHGMS